MASLRAAGHFLEKLELKSLDNPAGDEASHVVNRVMLSQFYDDERPEMSLTSPVCILPPLLTRSTSMPDTYRVLFLAPAFTTRSRDPRACCRSALPPH